MAWEKRGNFGGWSQACQLSCLPSLSDSFKSADSSSEFTDLSMVPEVYLDLKEVFNKARAMSLPPNHPYSCAMSSSLGRHHPRVVCNPSPVLRGRPWMNTSRGHYPPGSSTLPLLLLGLDYSLWKRRTRPSNLVLITAA